MYICLFLKENLYDFALSPIAERLAIELSPPD